MKSRRTGALALAASLAATSLVHVAGALPAAAHEHPTRVELIAPAVVQVRTDAVVDVALIEHNRGSAHITLRQESYRVPLATHSGFAVDPSGSVVTTARAVDVDLGRAETYAVNRMFNDRYGARAPLPGDPYARTRIVDTDPRDPLDARLQQCYRPNTTGESGGCLVTSRREVQVLPFVADQARYGNLPAEVVPLDGVDGDVAVLRVGASSMPTAPLATALGGRAYSVLGFTTTPREAASQTQLIGHFTEAGRPEVERDETYPQQLEGLRRGLQGGPVVSDTGLVVGFLHVDGQGPDATVTLVGPDQVGAALDAAGVTPASGPTDAAYESASHNYKNAAYAAAIPDLEATLRLYPGHGLATEFLRIAQAKAGTAEDLSGRSEGGSAPAVPAGDDGLDLRLVGGLAALALLALGLVLLLLRRRSGPGSAPPGPVPPPGPGQPPQSAPRPARSAAAAAAAARPPVAPRSVPDQPGPRPSAGVTEAGTPPAPRPGTARSRAGAPSGDRDSARARASGGRAAALVPGETVAGSPLGRLGRSQGGGAQPASDTTCPVCRGPAPADAEYCESCGYSLR